MEKIKKFLRRRLSPASIFFLAEFKNRLFKGYRRCFYSQRGEDVILDSIFKNKDDGFYVDVGAHHPRRYSNTFLLFKKGWTGINIDPNHYSIKLFNKERKRDVNLRLGVAEAKGEKEYYMFSDPALNTFSEKSAREYSGKKWVESIKKERMPVLPLREILERHLPPGRKIDLLNVDAEGMDAEVLRSNDWNRFSPSVIVVENENFDMENPFTSETFSLLKERGYKTIAFNGLSLILTKR